jgi:hypothetical protein
MAGERTAGILEGIVAADYEGTGRAFEFVEARTGK